MDLKQLEYIVAIAEEKSFSKAAKRLYVSQSALSQCLKRLEAADHLPLLFYREKNELLLTDAGRIYVNGAKTILNLAAEADRTARTRCSTIRLSIAPTGEYLFLTQVLPKFKEMYPDIHLTTRYYHSDTAKQQIIDGKLDLAVVIDQIPDYSLFRYFPIYEDQVVWISSAGCGLNPAALPVIMPPEKTFWRSTCDDIYYQGGMKGEIYCETTDLNIIYELLQRLPATSFLLESVYLEDIRVKKLDLMRDYPYYISAITSHNAVLPGPLEGLIKIICEHMNPFLVKRRKPRPVYRRADES